MATTISLERIAELKELQEIVTTYPSRISEWETSFLSSTIERIDKYGESTFLSEKQEAVLVRIEEKVYSS